MRTKALTKECSRIIATALQSRLAEEITVPKRLKVTSIKMERTGSRSDQGKGCRQPLGQRQSPRLSLKRLPGRRKPQSARWPPSLVRHLKSERKRTKEGSDECHFRSGRRTLERDAKELK